MKKTVKKLTLSRETLRTLQDRELTQPVGAGTSQPCIVATQCGFTCGGCT